MYGVMQWQSRLAHMSRHTLLIKSHYYSIFKQISEAPEDHSQIPFQPSQPTLSWAPSGKNQCSLMSLAAILAKISPHLDTT